MSTDGRKTYPHPTLAKEWVSRAKTCAARIEPQKVIVNKVLTVGILAELNRCAVRDLEVLLRGGIAVDTIFLKAHPNAVACLRRTPTILPSDVCWTLRPLR